MLRAPGLTAAQALNNVPDAVRYTFSYSPDRYADGVLADIEHHKEVGFEEIKLKNLWSMSSTKGSTPNGAARRQVCASKCSSTRQRAWRPRNSPMGRTNKSAAQIPHPAERDELEAFQRRVNHSSTLLPALPRSPTSRRNDMDQTITYYAIIDEFSSPERPGGVLRRVVDGTVKLMKRSRPT